MKRLYKEIADECGALLTPRENNVLQRYYDEEQTLKAIGEIYSVTSGRIAQIRNKALRKLRRALRSPGDLDIARHEAGANEAKYRALLHDYNRLAESNAIPPEAETDPAWHSMPLREVIIDTRTRNCFNTQGFESKNAGDLIEYLHRKDAEDFEQWGSRRGWYTLLRWRNFGKASLRDLVRTLHRAGVPRQVLVSFAYCPMVFRIETPTDTL